MLLHDRVLGTRDPALLWRLPRNETCCVASHFTVAAVLLEKNLLRKMPTRCVAGGCSNTPDLEKGITLHSIPYFGDHRPHAKKVGELCKAKEGKVGAFEERGHLFSALQARRFSTLPGRKTYNWWRQELVSKRHTEHQKAREVWYLRRRSKSLAE